MAVTLKGQSAIYEGTSADMKPTDADNNAIYKELDTGIDYYYDGTDWNEIPRSGSGGGGTGTDNYNELSNKPSINGTVLSGNKSLDNLGIQAKLTFDSAPTENSENPVESGGVYTALGNKQDTLSFDNVPTSGSSNPVKSGGVYSALSDKVDKQAGKGLSTNDFTTAEQTKLEGIEEEANKTVVDSALSGSSTNPVQNKVIKEALDGKQDALSSAQLAAANSGITADIVAADSAALTELVNEGAKNLLKNTAATQTLSGVTFTVQADGTIIANGTATASAILRLNYFSNLNLSNGNYVLSGCPAGGSANTYRLDITRNPGSSINDIGNAIEFEVGGSYTPNEIRCVILSGTVCNNLTFKPMICTKAEWDISHEYAPYALTNPELTAATIEMVDSGAKNLLNHTAYTRTVNDVTYTVNADRSITITSDGTNTQSLLYLVQNYTGVPAGNYVLSGCSGGSSTTYDLRVKVGSTTYINYDGGTEFYYNGTDAFESTIVVRASQTINMTIKPMVCSKAAWDISRQYVPYRPSYDELIARVVALENA